MKNQKCSTEIDHDGGTNYRVVIVLSDREFTSERMMWQEAKQFEFGWADSDHLQDFHMEKLIEPWGGGKTIWTRSFTR